MIGLSIEIVQIGEFHTIIKTAGHLNAPFSEERSIVAPANGIITFSKMSFTPGMTLGSGQVIAHISSKNLLEGDQTEKLRIQYESSRDEFERAQLLFRDSLISQAAYTAIRSTFEQAKLSYDALAEQYGTQGIEISSPVSGYIKNRWVADGEYVTLGQPLLNITGNKRIQLVADVSERNSHELPFLKTANFISSNGKGTYNLDDHNGRLVSYGRQLEANSNFIPVVFEFDNTGDHMIGSVVEVYLRSTPLENAITLPLTSLIEEQGLFFVFVKQSDVVYKKIEVKTGSNDGFRVLIKGGLELGQEVVTQGAYHLKLASLSTEIPHGHAH